MTIRVQYSEDDGATWTELVHVNGQPDAPPPIDPRLGLLPARTKNALLRAKFKTLAQAANYVESGQKIENVGELGRLQIMAALTGNPIPLALDRKIFGALKIHKMGSNGTAICGLDAHLPIRKGRVHTGDDGSVTCGACVNLLRLHATT